MQLQTYAKIGIVVGIASLAILTPFVAISAYLQHEHEFARLFVDGDRQLQLMKTEESFKNFLDRYPDAIVEERDHRHNTELDVRAFNNITGNELRLNMGYDFWDDRVYEHADCNVNDREIRKQLGPMPDTELTIPASMYKQGNAHDQYTAEFIKYTNCLEIGIDPIAPATLTEILKTTHYIAIPVGTGVPGCEETNECYNPYSLTVNTGDVVEWQNFDDAAHTVTSGTPMDDGPDGYFDTGLFMSQESFKIQFDESGTYDYFCMVHPWMTGEIVVVDSEPKENEK